MVSRAIADLFEKHRIERLAYLPCEQLKWLEAALPESLPLWLITREAAGIAKCFGWSLSGRRSAILIQSTGLGNLITEMMTLPVLYKAPLPLLVSWRGHFNEKIEAQVILGKRLVAMLRALDIPVNIIETADDLPKLDAGLARCFEESTAEVFMLSPQLWVNDGPAPQNPVGTPSVNAVDVHMHEYRGQPSLTRFEAIREVLSTIPEEAAVIAQIGFPAREAYAARDRARNLYLLGALGSASLVGAGLAEARPDLPVYVLDGDGGYILNPNQFLELAADFPPNLHVVVLDNGSWGSTGSQPTATARGLNLAAIGAAAGMPNWARVSTGREWQEANAASSRVTHFLIRAGNADVGTIPFTGAELRNRFQQSIGKGHA